MRTLNRATMRERDKGDDVAEPVREIERDCFCAYEVTPVMCPRHGVLPVYSKEEGGQ